MSYLKSWQFLSLVDFLFFSKYFENDWIWDVSWNESDMCFYPLEMAASSSYYSHSLFWPVDQHGDEWKDANLRRELLDGCLSISSTIESNELTTQCIQMTFFCLLSNFIWLCFALGFHFFGHIFCIRKLVQEYQGFCLADATAYALHLIRQKIRSNEASIINTWCIELMHHSARFFSVSSG